MSHYQCHTLSNLQAVTESMMFPWERRQLGDGDQVWIAANSAVTAPANR